jgi:hypothetical protein
MFAQVCNRFHARRLVRSALALLVFASAAAAQTTWYVDLNGTAPGSGTAADPYTSIQYAIAQPSTVDFDTVLVAPGEYHENISTRVPAHSFKRLHIRSLGGPAITAIRSDAVPVADLALSELDGFTVSSLTNTTGIGISACSATVRRCLITGHGLGYYACVDCFLYESTIAGNGLGMDVSGFDTVVVNNSILRGNTHDLNMHGSFTASYSVFSVNVPGVGNLNADPGYWNSAARDWRLKPGSVCIDAGDPSSPLDPDGTRADIGAFTYDASYAPVPTVYCSAKLNSQGCLPEIAASGVCSATHTNPFLISASKVVDNKSGLLFYGFGQRAQPFQGGLHCIQLPTKRSVGMNSGSNGLPPPGNFCSGAFFYDFNAQVQSGLYANLVPGALVYAQFWHRDPLDPAGFGTGLSNAICFGIAP